MAAEELGLGPLRPEDADAEFATWAAPWWVAGGWAIDLTLGHQTRKHEDLDVLVLRRDQAWVREELLGWDVHAADPPGSLRPWPVVRSVPRRPPPSRWDTVSSPQATRLSARSLTATMLVTSWSWSSAQPDRAVIESG